MTTIYLTEPGTKVCYHNQQLRLQQPGKESKARLAEVDLLVIFPGVQLTDVAIAILLDQGIETIFLRQDGQFRGRLQGQFATNPLLRLAQYRVVESSFGMALAQRLILGKVSNQRTILQRRHRDSGQRLSALAEAIDAMGSYRLQLRSSTPTYARDQLMGIEGICARHYFQVLQHCLPTDWAFTGRSRRPPKDPVNALLSWGYGVLLARVFSATVQAGLDPYLGFFHAIQPYRPNLALDLMEEFRPIVVDRAVIRLVRSGALDPLDFEPSPDGEGVWLGLTAKRLLLRELEKILQEMMLYPPQGRKLKVQHIILEQGRWLGRCCLESQLDYEPFLLSR
jgi:CRISPR-associated protein Cas1